MTATFVRKYLLIQLVIGWPVPLLYALVETSWSAVAIVSAMLFEMCLVGLAYQAASADCWWRQHGPGRWTS